jgi:hypothetical protein
MAAAWDAHLVPYVCAGVLVCSLLTSSPEASVGWSMHWTQAHSHRFAALQGSGVVCLYSGTVQHDCCADHHYRTVVVIHLGELLAPVRVAAGAVEGTLSTWHGYRRLNGNTLCLPPVLSVGCGYEQLCWQGVDVCLWPHAKHNWYHLSHDLGRGKAVGAVALTLWTRAGVSVLIQVCQIAWHSWAPWRRPNLATYAASVPTTRCSLTSAARWC